MRRFIVSILILLSLGANGQVIIASPPYKPTTASAPGACSDSIHVEAENYTAKSSSVFTGAGCDPADIGGTDINDWGEGEYVSFTLSVACTGTYRLKVRMTGGASTISVYDGIAGSLRTTITTTSAYFCDYKTDEVTLSLTAGTNTFTFYTSASQGFNWFELVK